MERRRRRQGWGIRCLLLIIVLQVMLAGLQIGVEGRERGSRRAGWERGHVFDWRRPGSSTLAEDVGDEEGELLEKRGGKMGRHLVAAATAAALAMGTAAMGVTTYALRLTDFNGKMRRDRKKKERERDREESPSPPDSPASANFNKAPPPPPPPQVTINNIYVHGQDGKDGSAKSTSVTVNVPPTGGVTLHKRFELPHAVMKELASLSRSASSRFSQTHNLFAEGARVLGHGVEHVAHVDDLFGRVAKSVSPISRPSTSGASTAVHKIASSVKDPDARIFGKDVTKYVNWAPFLAKVEDYGKLSAASGAFAAGAISLHTAVGQHRHEVEEAREKKRKDEKD